MPYFKTAARLFGGIALLITLSATRAEAIPPTYAHIHLLSAVPGSQGNGTLFTGQVCWIGIIGSGSCFPGYANNVSQCAFHTYVIPPASQK